MDYGLILSKAAVLQISKMEQIIEQMIKPFWLYWENLLILYKKHITQLVSANRGIQYALIRVMQYKTCFVSSPQRWGAIHRCPSIVY